MASNCEVEDNNLRFQSSRWPHSKFSVIILTFVCSLVVLVGAVLFLTPTNADQILMQKLWARKSPVKYYWIPLSSVNPIISQPSSQMKVRSGQALVEESDSGDSAAKATTPDTELPPYGETVEDPSPECDIAAMANCLGALESQIASLKETTESNAETADFFCRNMKEPFQCACKACQLDQLGQWDYMYYHSNVTDRAKQLLSMMRVDAQCKKLRSIGAQYFPAGHGCNMLYSTVCTDPQMVSPRETYPPRCPA